MPQSAAAAATPGEEDEEEMSPADDPSSDSAGDDGDEEEEEVEDEEEVEEGEEEKLEEGEKEQLEGSEEDEEEEQEEEQDEEVEDEQGQEEVEAEDDDAKGSDFSDLSDSMDEDAKEELKVNTELNAHVEGDVDSSLPLIGPSSELVAEHDKDMKPEVSFKHMVDKNGLPESFTEIDATEVNVGARDPGGAELAKSMHLNVGEVIKQTLYEKCSGNGEPDINIHTKKEMLHFPSQVDLEATDKKLTGSSSSHPHRRSRSPSANAILGNQNKRPAAVCDFYARGWCIKGKSCRFLHQKDGVDANSKGTVEDPAGQSSKELQDEKGLGHEVSKPLTLQGSLASQDAKDSLLKSQLSLQRALVRAYGGESNGISQLVDEHMPHAVQREKLHLEFTSANDSVQTTAIDSDLYLSKYHKNTSMKSRDFGGKIPGSGHPFDSPLNEIPKASNVHEEYNHSYGIRASQSPFTGSSLNPLIQHPLSGSSVGSSMHQISKYPFTSNKGLADPFVLREESQFSHHDSRASYSFISPKESSYTNSCLSFQNPSSNYALTQPLASSTLGSPLSTEFLDTHKNFNLDRGYFGSRSASLPQSSSPYFSRPEPEKSPLQNIPDNPLLSGRNISKFQANSWEPSVPFRPSFPHAPSSVTSSGNQYDPLLDSIEPPSAFIGAFHGSQITNTQSSSQHSITDPALCGNQSSGYNAQKHLNLLPQSSDFALGKNTSGLGLGGYSSSVSAFVSYTGDGENVGSMSKERTLSPDHVVGTSDIHEMDLNNYLSQEDKGRHKESKASKIFRSALVEFVKELVKPAWREGHLSKDAHKMIVKKAVEKVFSALQSHQIPSSTESINHYLSSSRPKLTKLVEGYVDKYAKS